MCFFRRKKKKEVVKEAPKTEVKQEEVKEEPKKVEEKKVVPEKVEETKEEPEKAENKKESDKFAYHISQVKNEKSEFYKMWRIRRSGSDKVIKHFKTQKEAIDEAKTYIKGNKDASLVIHGVDGKIRKQKY